MAASSRSISQRLAKAKAPGVREDIIAGWIADWQLGHALTIARLDRALREQDVREAARAAEQMHAMHSKHLAALPRVIKAAGLPVDDAA